MNTKIWIHTFMVVTLLLTGVSAAWAECKEGKSEVVLYTPSGNTNTLCVSDNALPGIENANERHKDKLDICEEVTCPCWDAETLENLPDLVPDTNVNPSCADYYNSTFFAGYDPQNTGPSLNGIAVINAPDYYEERRECFIYVPYDGGTWGPLTSPDQYFGSRGRRLCGHT